MIIFILLTAQNLAHSRLNALLINHRDEIERRIRNYFSIKNKYYRYYDKTDDGTVVVNATTCNLAAMKQVKELLDEEEQKVVIIHFFFQLPYLQEYFGDADNVEYCLFSYTDMFGE